MTGLEAFLQQVRPQISHAITDALADRVTDKSDPGRLREAMRYATDGGKRLRPAMVLAAAQAVGGKLETAMPAAVSIELLHAYTLVHDDLPAMDNDVERRGKPTVHVKYGAANAILVGDALLTEAFAQLGRLGQHAAAAITLLASRAGARELLAGQAEDLDRSNSRPGMAELEAMHGKKTGALFSAAAELGAIAVGANARDRERLAAYGLDFGIAFQHADDLADADHPHLAKEAARRRTELVISACDQIADFGSLGVILRDLTQILAPSM